MLIKNEVFAKWVLMFPNEICLHLLNVDLISDTYLRVNIVVYN